MLLMYNVFSIFFVSLFNAFLLCNFDSFAQNLSQSLTYCIYIICEPNIAIAWKAILIERRGGGGGGGVHMYDAIS